MALVVRSARTPDDGWEVAGLVALTDDAVATMGLSAGFVRAPKRGYMESWPALVTNVVAWALALVVGSMMDEGAGLDMMVAKTMR